MLCIVVLAKIQATKHTPVRNLSIKAFLPLLFSAEGGGGTHQRGEAAKLCLCCAQVGFIKCSELSSRESKGNKSGSKLSSNSFTEMVRAAQFGCLWLIFQIKTLNYAGIKAQN